jgi:hypothetical protein
MEGQRGTRGEQPACWCTEMQFDAKLLAKVPRQAKGRACICRACAAGPSPA